MKIAHIVAPDEGDRRVRRQPVLRPGTAGVALICVVGLVREEAGEAHLVVGREVLLAAEEEQPMLVQRGEKLLGWKLRRGKVDAAHLAPKVVWPALYGREGWRGALCCQAAHAA